MSLWAKMEEAPVTHQIEELYQRECLSQILKILAVQTARQKCSKKELSTPLIKMTIRRIWSQNKPASKRMGVFWSPAKPAMKMYRQLQIIYRWDTLIWFKALTTHKLKNTSSNFLQIAIWVLKISHSHFLRKDHMRDHLIQTRRHQASIGKSMR